MRLTFDEKMIDRLGIREDLEWLEEARKTYENDPRPAYRYEVKDKLMCLFYDLKARKAERKITESEMYRIFDQYREKYMVE